MSKTERLSTQDYDLYMYEIDRISEGGMITVVLRNLHSSPYGVCSYVRHRDIGRTVESKLLNWHNVFFCSNYYGVPPHQEYMSSAVQQGKKPSATIPVVSDGDYIKLASSIPDNCCIIPYYETPMGIAMAYVYRKGTLSDLFDFEAVKKVYILHGISDVKWDDVNSLFFKPLDYFADKKKCGFDIQSGSSKREDLIVLGLLLGYPIESTIATIKNDYKVFGNRIITSDVHRHFGNSSVPYIDQFGAEWHSDGKVIYLEGQQEALYGIHSAT